MKTNENESGGKRNNNINNNDENENQHARKKARNTRELDFSSIWGRPPCIRRRPNSPKKVLEMIFGKTRSDCIPLRSILFFHLVRPQTTNILPSPLLLSSPPLTRASSQSLQASPACLQPSLVVMHGYQKDQTL